MPEKVFVTGLGIISGLGNGVHENLESLKNSQTGIGKNKFLNTKHKEIPVSQVKYSNDELIALASNCDCEGFSRTSLLGLLAARESYYNAQFDKSTYKTGLFNGTTVGGMDRSEDHYKDFLKPEISDFDKYISSHDCGDSTSRIARSLKIKDYISTISTACSSSANTIMHAAEMIRSGRIQRAIAGGTDSLSKFTLNGFNTLLILDKDFCKPFDKNRAGLNLGEGAAYLALESESVVRKENKKVLAELVGFANANDAYHQTASSPDGFGAYLAMNNALTASGLKSDQISYINAHGTATPNNDLSEGLAIQKIFTGEIPFVSSTKALTGHTLGAAGAIEAVISILSINENMIFPNLNFRERMDELSFSPVTELLTMQIDYVLSNSFGFGGNNTSLIFGKV